MFDLVLFCLGQERVRIPESNLYIEAGQAYSRIWKFISGQKGIWYNLYTHENEIYVM